MRSHASPWFGPRRPRPVEKKEPEEYTLIHPPRPLFGFAVVIDPDLEAVPLICADWEQWPKRWTE